jgi:hypothetical protein
MSAYGEVSRTCVVDRARSEKCPGAVIAIVVAWRQRQSATLSEGNFYALYLASLEYYWLR